MTITQTQIQELTARVEALEAQLKALWDVSKPKAEPKAEPARSRK